MHKFAVILGGGSGLRAGGGMPKQFRLLDKLPVILWSVKAFREADPATRFVVVLHREWINRREEILGGFLAYEPFDTAEINICEGGADRTSSVANALRLIADIIDREQLDPAETMIAVHDGARPLVTPALADRGWSSCSHGVCGVPAVAPTSSLRLIKGDSTCPVNRDDYLEVQTPQMFMADDILACYSDPGEGPFTDDASLAQQKGLGVKIFEGDRNNIKITGPLDHKIALLILEETKKI